MAAMDLRQMRSFVHVAELRSFSRAAAFLNVSQPALSRQMRLLEEELGAKLFHRTGRGVALTDAGALLLDRSARILGEVEDMRGELNGGRSASGLAGAVSIGVSVNVSPLLAGFLARCRKLHPGLSVRVVEGFSALLHEWLLTGAVDFAVLYGPRPSRVIRSDSLLAEDLYAIGVASAENRARRAVSPAELATAPLILPHRPHVIRELVQQTGVQPAEIIEVDAPGLQIELARAGRGWAILPLTCVTTHLAAGQVCAVPIHQPSLSWTATLSQSALKPLTAPAAAAFKLLREEVAALVKSGRWPARLV
jgi:LysR family transcriptional regulator, nitrogen assimilation regulatory protein